MFEQFESRYVQAAGIRTHYVERGEGEPLVLVHGGGAGADGRSNFEANIPVYAERYRVIAYDMPGFGLSDKPDPSTYDYTQTTRNAHLAGFIEALDAGPVHLVGNSMGGSTTCGVTIERPDLVKSLVLMGAAINVSAQDMIDNRPNLGAVLGFDDTKAGMERIVDALTYDYQATPDMIDYRFEMSQRPDAKAAYKAIMKWAGSNGLEYSREDLAKIMAPTLVVAGKNDIMVKVEKAYDALGKIEQAEGHIFPMCGHWVMIEYPEAFCELTMRFFQRASA
ncbi:MAG: alpha/beta fold hydrolase [Kiloniellales bacterium]